DVATAIDVTLTDTTVKKIPSTATGPLVAEDSELGGLLVGRSSSGVKGIIVIPGVIDADFTGTIQIMIYTICPPIFIPKGSRIAQIIAIPKAISVEKGQNYISKRGNKGFGSTGAAVCFTTTMMNRPEMQVIVKMGDKHVKIRALLDTGADVTIIS
ncbi:POK9 protein, partial [Brachypteracias leptosomus]|nr:POK9 protein [Brachypteracias leptosomus]